MGELDEAKAAAVLKGGTLPQADEQVLLGEARS
jgi:hypothetical protein